MVEVDAENGERVARGGGGLEGCGELPGEIAPVRKARHRIMGQKMGDLLGGVRAVHVRLKQ